MPLDVLLRTKCGSHAWGMDHPDSDTDWFTVYRTPTREILRSPAGIRGVSIRDKQEFFDEMKHECGLVVNMLGSGNVNFVVGVMSPAVDVMTPEAEALRRILTDYPSKAIFDSANGLAKSNFQKYVVMGYCDTPKKRALIMRTIRFATRIIEDGVYDFRVVKPNETFTMDDVGGAFRRLREASAKTNLRSTYPKDMLADWLFRVRMESLRKEGTI